MPRAFVFEPATIQGHPWNSPGQRNSRFYPRFVTPLSFKGFPSRERPGFIETRKDLFAPSSGQVLGLPGAVENIWETSTAQLRAGFKVRSKSPSRCHRAAVSDRENDAESPGFEPEATQGRS